MSNKENVFIGIGSNIGNRISYIRKAIYYLKQISNTTILKLSSIYETEPIGEIIQRPFLNAVLELQTSKNPLQLLHSLQKIEQSLGRVRLERWGPRTIDLDILLFGRLSINHPDLVIPHPYLCSRRFALKPLSEIAPDHFIDDRSVKDVLHACTDDHRINWYATSEYILSKQEEFAC